MRTHGKVSTYNKIGCRCEPCRKAMAESRRRYPRTAANPRYQLGQPKTFDPGWWRDHAACRTVGNKAFFPKGVGADKEAKAICAGCPVKGECLAYALDTGQTEGVWGGLNKTERERLRRSA